MVGGCLIHVLLDLNVVEANALGVPAVAYDVHGLRASVRNGETRLLAEAGNAEDLADRVIIVLKDDALRERLSRNALEYSKFSWNEAPEEFMRLLKQVVY